MSLLILPKDILLYIFTDALDPLDITMLRATCSTLRNIIKDNATHHRLYCRFYMGYRLEVRYIHALRESCNDGNLSAAKWFLRKAIPLHIRRLYTNWPSRPREEYVISDLKLDLCATIAYRKKHYEVKEWCFAMIKQSKNSLFNIQSF